MNRVMQERRQSAAHFVRLPHEVLHHILSLLDSHSLLQISLVNRELCTIAEPHLYSNFDLIRYSPFIKTPERPMGCNAPPTDRLDPIIAALQARPQRIAMVKSFSALIPHMSKARCAEILFLTSETLMHFELCFPSGPWSGHMLDGLDACLKFQAPQFISLTTLKLPYLALGSSLLTTLLRRTPRLTTLELLETAITTLSSMNGRDLPKDVRLEHLRYLKLERLTLERFPAALELLQRATNLESLSIISVLGLLHHARWEAIAQQVRQLQSLKALEADLMHRWSFSDGGFFNLTHLILHHRADICYIRNLQDLEIPPLPNLETLTLGSHSRMSTSNGVLCQHTRYLIPDIVPAVPIPRGLYDKLVLAPRLKVIHFCATVFDSSKPYYPEVDETFPLREITETIRIKSALMPRHSFVWCKASTHLVVGNEGQIMHVKQTIDQDWISMDGVKLELEVLKAVMNDGEVKDSWIASDRSFSWETRQHLRCLLEVI